MISISHLEFYATVRRAYIEGWGHGAIEYDCTDLAEAFEKAVIDWDEAAWVRQEVNATIAEKEE